MRLSTLRPAKAASALKAQEALGRDFEVLEFEASTRTAADAAAAIGCTIPQIAKSLIFRASGSGRPILVIASGAVRVDVARVSALLGENIEKADADFARDSTGFAIGGVPPIGHRIQPVVFIDELLLGFETIWAAAGTPNAVFSLRPEELVRLTDGIVAEIAE